MTTADIVVVGAGIAGMAAALELVERGRDVLVIDRGGVSGGTTGLGEGNALCGDKQPGCELDLARLGLAMFDEIEDRYGQVAGIRRKGALIVPPGQDGPAVAAAHAARLESAGVAAEAVAGDRLRELEPELSPDLAAGVLVPGDLQCDPRAITIAMASDLVAQGGRLMLDTEVAGVAVRNGAAVGVETVHGLVGAEAVVLAAGPWSAALAASAGLNLPVEPRKGQLVRAETAAGLVRHKVIDGAYLGAVASDQAGLQVASVIETALDGTVLIGSSRERRGFDTSVDPDVSDAIMLRATMFMPRLAGLARVDAWAGLRPFLPDHLPAIGPSRHVPGLWATTGHEGSGVSLGPISGRLLAQAMCAQEPDADLAPFDVDRFQEAADAA